MVIIYSLTLFLSAFLVFLIQPLMGKLLLPYLGSGAQIWSVAMLSYQLFLLLGYLYAYFLNQKFNISQQIKIHLFILITSILLLPLSFIPENLESAISSPEKWLITSLTKNIAFFFILLSANTLIIQNLIANTKHKKSKNPYILYAASNVGSFSALLFYPFLIEPILTISQTMQLWSWVYSLFLICFIITIYDFSKSKAKNLIKDHAINQKKNIQTITLKLKFRWILLAFLPSSLMLSLTHLITNDLAAIPFLWSTTFAIYLFTFIIAFAGYKKLYQSTISAHIKASFIVILLLILLPKTTYILSFIPLHLLCFFIISLMCHGHLARIAPHKSYLSQFYVWIALGGMCGGFFITFISPHLFSNEVEYILLVIFSSLLRPSEQFKITLRELYKKDFIKIVSLIIGLLITFIIFQYLHKYKTSFDKETFKRTIQFIIIIFVFFYIIYSLKLHPQTRTILCLSLIILFFTAKIGIFNINNNVNTIHKDRDFYGTTIITENTSTNLRLLTHGNTVHGGETLNQNQGPRYYGYYKPIIDFFYNNLSTKKNIAIIGLGTGILAELNHKQKATIDFFEINPKIVEISQNIKYFSYLNRYKDNVKTHIGDGRILLSKQPDTKYDAIIIDAYNSDSIPTHLLTIEALQLYRTKLKKTGIIFLHISNRFFDLKNIIHTTAHQESLYSLHKLFTATNKYEHPSEWMILHGNDNLQTQLLNTGWNAPTKILPTIWSDNYTNIFQALNVEFKLLF